MDAAPSNLHATCIALDGGGAALFLGPAGAGKSDLALRCLTTPLRWADRPLVARLVGDDQVMLEVVRGRLMAMPPASIAGRLEIRGIGIVEVDHVPRAEVSLAVLLQPNEQIDRMPDPTERQIVLGVSLPVLRVDPFVASSVVKVMLGLAGVKSLD